MRVAAAGGPPPFYHAPTLHRPILGAPFSSSTSTSSLSCAFDIGEQTAFALGYAFFDGDLEKPRIEFPLFWDSRLLCLGKRNDVQRLLE